MVGAYFKGGVDSMRKIPLVNDGIYHVFSKSIAKYVIFRMDDEYDRMKALLSYYNVRKPAVSFSSFLLLRDKEKFYQRYRSSEEQIVKIIAYCFMPTHIHLILKQITEDGISIFMQNILNSYTRYFNTNTKRKGPLWESRFKNVMVNTDEQLMHLTRYVHLNPVTAYLTDNPTKWKYSSMNEFTGRIKAENNICEFSDLMEVDFEKYIEFVNNRINEQRELAICKDLLFE